MNILVGNSSKFFFPIFTLNAAYYSDFFAILFIIIHIILSMFCCLLTIQVCMIIKTVHVFHSNMSTIIIFILAQWFEALLAKIIFFPYQIGLVTVGNNAKVFQFWITKWPSEMPQIEETSELTPLLFSGTLFLHYAFTLTFSIFMLTCERACATFFINDYEKKPRAYICITLLLLVHITTLSLSYLSICEILSFATAIAIAGIMIIFAVVHFFIILRINIAIQKRLDDHNQQQLYYSLAVRFQAKENARSLELAKKVVLFTSFSILIGLVLLVVIVMHWMDEHIAVMVTFAEAVFNLNPLIIVPVGMYSVPMWRERYCQSSRCLLRIQKLRIRNTQKVSAITENMAAKESEIYFNQLSEAWK